MPKSKSSSAERVIVIGAGIGGLVTALELAAAGLDVLVLERAATPGGKLRQVQVGQTLIDAGPTVFTMRWVFDEIFAGVGLNFGDQVPLIPAVTLARHAWNTGDRLDLFTDLNHSADAIGNFAGAAEAKRFLEFSERARRIYRTLEGPFLRAPCASPAALMRAIGARRMGDLMRISPFTNLWRALGQHFYDPRLQQLFGRYATYCGSSPYLSPATLMLVAHVEQDGVWLIGNGMYRLVTALVDAAKARGARFSFDAHVSEIVVRSGRADGVRLQSGERIDADAVIANVDPAALSSGLLGRDAGRAVRRMARSERSLSAMTWASVASTAGFPLLRHNVFFSADYAAEFDAIFGKSRLPASPTVYVCAQDRDVHGDLSPGANERLLCLVNAPANGDLASLTPFEIETCEQQTLKRLESCGLRLLQPAAQTQLTTPTDFDRLFPGTGGALYGPASHGWTASFNRPGARTRIPGLYLAGGSTHPGPGVPMAALSGRLASASTLQDLGQHLRRARGSASPSRQTVMSGGMSTPLATTAAKE